MDKSELDLVIKVQLFAYRNNSTGVDAKKHKEKEREITGFMSIICGHCSNHSCLNYDKLMTR
jgi:hypothetical protein